MVAVLIGSPLFLVRWYALYINPTLVGPLNVPEEYRRAARLIPLFSGGSPFHMAHLLFAAFL
jgi:hypothetical protein